MPTMRGSRLFQAIGADGKGEYARVRPWLLGRFNAYGQGNTATQHSIRLPADTSHWQRGCPELIPGK